MSNYESWASKALFVGVVLFLAGFFAVPDNNAHRVVFYLFVLLPAIIALPLLLRFVKNNLVVLGWPLCTVGALFVPVFWSPDFGGGLVDDKFKAMLYIMFWLVVSAYIISNYPEQFLGGLKFLVGVALVAAIYIVWDRYSGNWDFKGTLITDWRYYNQNRMAKCFAFALFVSLGLALLVIKSYLAKAFYIACAFVFFAIIVLSKSSGVMLAIVVTLPLLFFVVFRELFDVKLVLSAIVMLASVVFVLWLSDHIDHHFNSGWSKRDVIWLSIWYDFLKEPWFGQGLLENVRVTATDGRSYGHEHNLFFALLRHSGLFGFILFSVLLGKLALESINSNQLLQRLWLIVLALGILESLSTGKYPLERPGEDWIMIWIPVAFLLGFHALARKKVEEP